MQAEREAGITVLLAARRLILALTCATTTAFGADFSGRVVGVSDGDTISVMRDGRAVRVRLEGIDCPENGQPFGRAAKKATSELVSGRDVSVADHGLDRYGRTIGRIFIGHADLSLELVRLGMAWHFLRYSGDPALARAEEEARKAKRGLWVDADPLPPWEWRRHKPARGARR